MQTTFFLRILVWCLPVLTSLAAGAQRAGNAFTGAASFSSFSPPALKPPKKLFQRNTGMILGWQRGRYSVIELGVESHWRKLSLLKPHLVGATVNMEYNFGNHVLGYKAGAWMKRGRINLTYGANLGYFTNFKGGHRFGFGPAVGFRLLGFHLINGFNFLTSDQAAKTDNPVPVNSLSMTLRYYFPVQNRFVWDRQTRLRKKERRQAREQRKKEKAERRQNGGGGLFRILKKKDQLR